MSITLGVIGIIICKR